MITDAQPIELESVRPLTLEAGESGGPTFIAAASGLVMAHGRMFVIADDQLSLAVFSAPAPTTTDATPHSSTNQGETTLANPAASVAQPAHSHGQMHAHPLIDIGGALPSEHAERKKHKPDWESLLLLDDESMPPHGALLAVPSGSAANRIKGSLCRFTSAAGDLAATATAVDVSALYGVLSQTFAELNIEGGCVGGGRLTLFQRGNGAAAHNGIVDLDLAGVLEDLRADGAMVTISPARVQRLVPVDLGQLAGVQLGFTDAFRDPQLGTWFLAAAEASASTYADGAYVGSVLGRISDDGRVQLMRPLRCPFKPEGLWIDAPTRSFFVVTDADDPENPAILYRGQLPADAAASSGP